MNALNNAGTVRISHEMALNGGYDRPPREEYVSR